ncbi:Rv0909 family putative TA system antitoxin [Nocardia farcinica]|nr:Rv0909 family putative TA system antitoxin [Nocardia farcinica]
MDGFIVMAGFLVDEKTGGMFAGLVDAAQDAAKNAIRKEG